MTQRNLVELLRQQFPDAVITGEPAELSVGSFPQWDSLGHFNFLMLVEETYGVRFTLEEMTELKGLAEIGRTIAAKGIAIA
jgi:acyl carrier protein